MSAGNSIAHVAAETRATAIQLERIMRQLHREASNAEAAAHSERELGRTLASLESGGCTILADRRWPGSKRAQVDFVVVGPGGVFLVDAKSWAELRMESNGRLVRVFRGDEDVTYRFEGFAGLLRETQVELGQIGLAPSEVQALAVFTNRPDLPTASVDGVELMNPLDATRRILGRGERLTPEQVAELLAVVEEHFKPYEVEAPVAVESPAASAMVIDMPEPDDAALFSVDDVNDAILEAALREPIESWMSFLHPEQARIVCRSFSGPSRIRGAAGTGKTVVGLHRAAHLARTRPGRVLVTSFVRTLPEVLRERMRSLAPEVADRIDFSSVHQLAHRILSDAHVRVRPEQELIDAAWTKAWLGVGRYSQLGDIDRTGAYWRDEIAHVIKGRGLEEFEAYRTSARPGRIRRLTANQRVLVWDLKVRYERELDARNAHDWADVVNRASALVAAGRAPHYSAIVIDEAQDLTAAMIRLLHRLVGDGPDALTLIGDGRQSIYPGGFTLAEVGISLAGRGVVLERNYRNTVEIAEFASSFSAARAVDMERGGTDVVDASTAFRHGARPRMLRFGSDAAHDARVVAHVSSLLASGVAAGDIGVLMFTNAQASRVLALLSGAGLAAMSLLDYTGVRVDAVKVGTIKRAKGLEFAHVLLVRMPVALLAPTHGVAAAAAMSPEVEERRDLERRELYVAMTRARDGLWVGAA